MVRAVSSAKAGARTGLGAKRWLGIIGLLTAAALLQACSAVKLAYNQAPQLAYFYLDGYVDFDSAQSLKMKEELHKLHDWHRQTQLPGYADALQQLRQQLASDIQPQAACAVFEDVRARLAAVTARAEPIAAAVVPTLQARQLQQMEKKFSKINVDYRDDFLDGTPQKLRDKRIKDMVRRAETLYGSLEKPQLELIAARVDASGFRPERAYAERLRRQRDALQTLAPLVSGAGTPAQAQVAVNRLVERMLSSPDREYRSYVERFTRENCDTFSALHNSTNTKQRAKAAEVLRDYENHFRMLAARDA